MTYGLDRPLTGIGRYTLELARAMQRLGDSPELALLAAGGLGPLAEDVARSVSLRGCRLLPALMTVGNVVIPLAARRLGLDVVHDPTGVTPMAFGAGGARRVVTVHDVFAWSYPGHSSLLDTVIYRLWLPRLLARMDAVITVSNQSRSDIEKYLGVLPTRLHIIPYGVAWGFRMLPPEEAKAHVAKRFGLSSPYVLYVGALTLRKNVERALEAFSLNDARVRSMRFVLAGPRTWKQTPVESVVRRLRIAHKVLMTGPLTDADLPALYSAADLFVFPSLYEGFGLPPLEAMACGTPVVCSNAASLPEVVGDAALQVDPTDVEALAEAMLRVLTDAELAADLRERGLARAAGFTWERTARETVAVYERVLAEDR